MIRYYREVSRGGVGLVIVENSHVDNKASKSAICQLSSSNDEHKSGLTWLAFTIKSNGAKACLQLGHAGGQKFLRTPPIKAPSRVTSEEGYRAGISAPEELTFEEIREIVESFGDAALRAKQSGFDMIEILGCHGYLVTNFLSPRTNRRTDCYGGDLENRMRFLIEVIDNIFMKVGKDYPLSVRLNGTDYEKNSISIEETKKVALALEGIGVSTIHVSGGGHNTIHKLAAPMYGSLATNVWAAEELKKVVRIPIIASGSITTPQLAETILDQGKADFISLGRPLLADPYFPVKAQEGRLEDICPCIRCLDGCNVRGFAIGSLNCTVNATIGREDELRITPALRPRSIAVIGGGPAGMEAARVAALRGHQVTLFEKRKLGGILIEASTPEFKADIRRLIDYLSIQIKRTGVKIVDKEATCQMIKDGRFEAVIVATGATSSVYDVPGINKPNVVSFLDIFQGAKTGENVIVVGGGKIGCDVTLFLAEQRKKVTVTTRGDDIARDMNRAERLAYFERLSTQNVEIRTGVHLEKVMDKGIIVGDKTGSKFEIKGDHVVLAPGLVPNRRLFDELDMIPNLKVYGVGDCVVPRTIYDAIHEGYWTAFNLI
jgi:2,4-dienoyl-CoA reductase-like NADH-dependent reductase (Old Yellow Enzyme family)/thioredoxin reductase